VRIKQYCDQCRHFTFGDHPNNCSKGHKMKFRVPKHMGDAVSGNYGYHMTRCPDRSPTSTGSA